MADEIYSSSAWGSGVCDNEINWGKVYKDYAGCEDASFSYGASSYCTTDSNPTPTITGDAGGTFSATPVGMTINSSTGRITLSSTTPQAYTVKYLLSGGTFATQTVTVNSCFVNAYSMLFDGIDDYVNTANIIGGTASISASFWCKTTQSAPLLPKYPIGLYGAASLTHSIGHTGQAWTGGIRYAKVGSTYGTVQLNDGDWHHLVWTREMPSGDVKVYVDGNTTPDVTGTYTGTYGIANAPAVTIGAIPNSLGVYVYHFEGHVDEVAYWNSVLSTAAVTEIYNSGAPNDLSSLSNAVAPTAWYRMGD